MHQWSASERLNCIELWGVMNWQFAGYCFPLIPCCTGCKSLAFFYILWFYFACKFLSTLGFWGFFCSPVWRALDHLLWCLQVVTDVSHSPAARHDSLLDARRVYSQGCVYFCVLQSKDKGQVAKVSKMNGLKKIEDEEERREMITPALRESLTKQGRQKKVSIKGK